METPSSSARRLHPSKNDRKLLRLPPVLGRLVRVNNYQPSQSMKTKLLGILVLASSLMLCSGQTPAQKKPLTNADVLQMVKAGLAEAVIVAAIQSNPANYDTSPTA